MQQQLFRNRDGGFNTLFLDFAERNGIVGAFDHNMDADAINAALRDQWIRTGKEDDEGNPVNWRYQIKGRKVTDEEWAVLNRLGQTAPITCEGQFDLALVSSAMMSLGERRFNLLAKHLANGATFVDGLVVIGSGRKLNPEKEDIKALCEKRGWQVPALGVMPNTEFRMMRFLAESYQLPLHLQSFGIDDESTSLADTVIGWMQKSKEPWATKEILLFSNQPYAEQQRLAVELALPRTCRVSVVADAASRGLPFETFLDNLAKQFHLELLADQCQNR